MEKTIKNSNVSWYIHPTHPDYLQRRRDLFGLPGSTGNCRKEYDIAMHSQISLWVHPGLAADQEQVPNLQPCSFLISLTMIIVWSSSLLELAKVVSKDILLLLISFQDFELVHSLIVVVEFSVVLVTLVFFCRGEINFLSESCFHGYFFNQPCSINSFTPDLPPKRLAGCLWISLFMKSAQSGDQPDGNYFFLIECCFDRMASLISCLFWP